MRLLLILAALALVCAVPVVHDEQVLLEEQYEHHVAAAVRAVHAQMAQVEAEPAGEPDEAPAPLPDTGFSHSTHVVATAVMHVHKGAKKSNANERALKAKWKKDLKNSHWHCRHCHSQCKTDHCRKWCHRKFCGPHYDGGVKLGRQIPQLMLNAGERIIPSLLKADRTVNKHLKEAEHATTLSSFRKANRALKHFDRQKVLDMEHFKRQIYREDNLDKAAYPSRRKRKSLRKERRTLNKLHQKAKEMRSEERIERANRRIADDKGYMQGAKAEMKIAKMMQQGSMLGSLMKTTQQNAAMLKSQKKSDAKQVSSTKVAEQIAKMKVESNSIKKTAQKAKKAAKGKTAE